MSWKFHIVKAVSPIDNKTMYQAVAEVEGEYEGYVSSDWGTKEYAEQSLVEMKKLVK